MGAREHREIGEEPDERRAGMTSDEIRDEIDRTLYRMDQTLDKLGQRFRPGHLIGDVVDYVRRPHQSNNRKTIIEQEEPPGVELETKQKKPAGKGATWRRSVASGLVVAGIAWMLFEEERARKDAGKRPPETSMPAPPPSRTSLDEEKGIWRRFKPRKRPHGWNL